jgi:hypothetical protein
MADHTWRQAVSGYQVQYTTLKAAGLWRAPPLKAPPTPWLVVWLTLFAVAAERRAILSFGEVEQKIAWTLIP